MAIETPERSKDCLQAVQKLQNFPKVIAALKQAQDQQDQRIAEQISLTEIPSPSNLEGERAKLFQKLLADAGLPDTHIDDAGNVIGEIRGQEGPTLIIAAHMDTVFPAGTEIKVRREGSTYFAPGISDDAAGLACVLQVVRCLKTNAIPLNGNIVIVGTVGEEGNGDLKGSKALWSAPNHYDGFIAVDSASPHRILKGSVGCKRFRITYSGPGGHSLHKFGLVSSASHALCRAGAMIADLQAPQNPKCTYNIGVLSGGTSVNAIAASASMELDIRSYNQQALESFVQSVLPIFQQAADKENLHWNTSGCNAVTVEVTPIGDRPAGINPPESSVIAAAYESMLGLGIELKKFTFGATDQNIPLAMGVPATTLGAGGSEENNHSLRESWDAANAFLGPQLVLLTALTLVGVNGCTQPTLNSRR